MVEAAVTLSLSLTMVLGMRDLGIALMHKDTIVSAARRGAREAVVHGYFAPNNSTPPMKAWGPTPSYYPALASPNSRYNSSTYSSTPYTVQADNTSDDLANTIRPYLAGLDPSTVTIGIQWPDGDNDTGNRVTVSLVCPQNLIPFIFGNSTGYIKSSSTMTIMH